jgi:phytoene dehydrogenase-like protein
MGELSAVLASAASQNGAEIRTNAAVASVLLQDGRANGVILADGSQIMAKKILCNADPKRTFFDLVGPQNLEPRFMRAVRNIIFRGSTAKVNLALSGLPQFSGQSKDAQLSGHVLINPSLDYLEQAYDDAKYGRMSTHPVLDIVIPTLLDSTLAPAGHHIMSITLRYAPYHLREGSWEEEREALGDRCMATLAGYAPGIQELILHRQVLTPLDYEQIYGLTEGSVMHGQMGLDQLMIMRPLPGWSQYRTPIENLYLCGAGTHPGGGVTGAPGYNAAREVLKALK